LNTGEILRIAVRYTFAFGRGHLSTFLSSLSMAGLVLAISLLVTVLSVMNGFDKEMRERILSLVPHITVYSHSAAADWNAQQAVILQHPEVLSVTPFVEFDALFMRDGDIETAKGIGIDAANELANSRLLELLDPSQRQGFQNTADGLILGKGVAARLGVQAGDNITLIVPARDDSLAPQRARFETLQVSAILETNTELDQSAAFLHLAMASELAGLNGQASGLRVATTDIFGVSRISWDLLNQFPPGFYSTNWMMTHGNLYAAIQLSRDLVTVLLLSIIAVAAFNVVSSLVLVVFDKRGSIAILRTLGASPANIAWVFILQGGMIGLVGVGLGSLLGVGLSLAVPGLVAALEDLLGFQFLSTDVYPVSFLPVDLLVSDVLLVGTVAFGMCLAAAIYPALRAAGLAPAAILQQERS
jgi:lipoprotein-releasing system permease protein